MAHPCDPNEIMAFLGATSNVTLLQQIQQAVTARLTDLHQAQSGQAAHALQPHVQPTDVSRPAASSQPMTGPDPQGQGVSLQEQAAWNQNRERAQRESQRGPAPSPVAVQVGPESPERTQASAQALEEHQEAVARANQVPAPQGGGQQQGGRQGQQQAQAPAGGLQEVGSGQQAQPKPAAPGRVPRPPAQKQP